MRMLQEICRVANGRKALTARSGSTSASSTMPVPASHISCVVQRHEGVSQKGLLASLLCNASLTQVRAVLRHNVVCGAQHDDKGKIVRQPKQPECRNVAPLRVTPRTQ